MAISDTVKEFAGYRVEDYHPRLGIVLPVMPRREFRSEHLGEFWTIALETDRHTVGFDRN